MQWCNWQHNYSSLKNWHSTGKPCIVCSTKSFISAYRTAPGLVHPASLMGMLPSINAGFKKENSSVLLSSPRNFAVLWVTVPVNDKTIVSYSSRLICHFLVCNQAHLRVTRASDEEQSDLASLLEFKHACTLRACASILPCAPTWAYSQASHLSKLF